MSLPLPVQAAVISAITAAVVTLLIEYAAKPRLEARKDRIVESFRNRRDFQRHMLLTILLAREVDSEDDLEKVTSTLRATIDSSLGVAYHVEFLRWNVTTEFLRRGLGILENRTPRSSPPEIASQANEQVRYARAAWHRPPLSWRRPFAYKTLEQFDDLKNGKDPLDDLPS